uniref:Uncharacterized protein n=1 Tax=Romanomermis culicivorax TaxID=13658 RepID=A0A915IPT2_ROMCU
KFGAPKSVVLLILILSLIAALIFLTDRKAEFLANVLTIPYLAVCSSQALFRETGCPKCDDTMKWLFAWILLLQLDVSVSCMIFRLCNYVF